MLHKTSFLENHIKNHTRLKKKNEKININRQKTK